MKARFKNKMTSVTRNDLLVSNALAIQAIEALLIQKGLLRPGEVEKAVARLMTGKEATSEIILTH